LIKQNPSCPKHCRLCGGERVGHFARANRRDYLRCEDCRLVVVRQDQLPGRQEERAEVALHNNDPHDQRYRAHLAKLTKPLAAGLPDTAKGLDFGSGPGPAISHMLGEQGYKVANYDPAFAPDHHLLQSQYDFIACTEVVEHFHTPAKDFALLAQLLKPGGRLGVMTQMLSGAIDFEKWYYPREISHVATFTWIAQRYGWQMEIIGPDVVIFELL